MSDDLMEPISVSVTVLNQMFRYLNSRGFDIDGMLNDLQVDTDLVHSPDGRIPVDTYLMIQEEAARRTNDPYFGLHMGEFAEAGSWSILGYLMMNCRNLGEAFEKAGRYSRIIGNMIEARVEIHFNRIKIIYFTPPHVPPMSRHCFDSTFASGVRMMRNLTGVELSPVKVTFIYPQPESTTEYDRIFRCPVLFGQKQTSMTIDVSIINTPIVMANPGLLEYFERYAQEFLQKLDRQKETTRQVTRILLEVLDDDDLTIEKVARRMAVSVRTLQMRLADEGVVFSDLLNEVRQQLAEQYLREDYSVEQITYLLGFSEPSSFRKAFKRWSGVTPREYRESAIFGSPAA